MNEFWIGVISSIVASILIFMTSFYSKNIRRILVTLLGKLISIDIDQVYLTSRDAQKDIMAEIERTNNVKIVMGRGGELQRETYSRLLQVTKNYSSIQILLPRTDVKANEINWVLARENEILEFDTALDRGILAEQIDATVNFLKKTVKNSDNFKVRLFNAPDLGKIVITDNYLFYYLIKKNTHGRQNKMFRCKVGTETYNSFNRLFDLYFTNSIAIPT